MIISEIEMMGVPIPGESLAPVPKEGIAIYPESPDNDSKQRGMSAECQ